MNRTLIIIAAATLLAAGAGAAGDLPDAVRSGDNARVEALLAQGTPADQPDLEGNTSLMIAAAQGRTEMVRLLMAHGADVDARGRIGNTALLYAAQEGHAETVSVLLAGGADVRAANAYGTTALASAAGLGHADVAALLQAATAPPFLARHQVAGQLLETLCALVALVAVPVLTARLAYISFGSVHHSPTL